MDPAVLVRRQSQLPGRERPPHLVEGELEKRQRARAVADGLDEFVNERIADVKFVPLSRAADGLAQFAFVHAAHDDGVSPQRFPETLLAFDEFPERVSAEGEDDSQDAPVTKVAQLAQNRVAFPVWDQRLLELVDDDHGVLPPAVAGLPGGRREAVHRQVLLPGFQL